MNAPVREGEILAGKFRVERVLGVGGMGVVVAAQHIELDEKVAIKFLLPETLTNPEAVARFAREARAAVKIKSEHVAKVTDVGKLESGAPYMVMEYLEGGDLAAWLRQRGALEVEQAVEFLLQACEAIAQAHALGIVHRDLKPANLFVIRRADGSLAIKVLDFGISKLSALTGSGGDASITKTAALMGSPLYMSPEQMRSSKEVDARGDIWALGVILYELLTGAPPFTGDTMPELILQVVTTAPPPVRNGRPDLPNGLDAVVHKCLDKDRNLRYQTVGELALALLPYAPNRAKGLIERIAGIMQRAGMPASSTVLLPSSSELPSSPHSRELRTGTVTAGSWGRTTTPKRRGNVALFAGAGVALVAGIAVMMARTGQKDVSHPSDAPSSAATAPAAGAPLAQERATAASTDAGPVPSQGSAAASSSVISIANSTADAPAAPEPKPAVKSNGHAPKEPKKAASPSAAASPAAHPAQPPAPAPVAIPTTYDDRK